MTLNLITDVAGVRVGSVHDERLASGVTAVVFDEPAVASVAITGGTPAVRDTALLEPEMTVEQVDAFVLSGGSAFGLDAAGGVMAYLVGIGRGFNFRGVRVPIVPGASLFDLVNGGDKAWGARPPYWEMGFRAAEASGAAFALGTAGAGYGANSFGFKGGLGSASATTERGFRVGAIVAANPGGRVTRGSSKHFLAAHLEIDGEFGGHGIGSQAPEDARCLRLRSDDPANTTLAVVATDASLPKSKVKRLAVMAQAGFGLALRPALSPVDGDVVFAAATGRSTQAPDIRDLAELGMLAAECVARSIARAVYEASSLPFAGALPSWRERFRG